VLVAYRRTVTRKDCINYGPKNHDVAMIEILRPSVSNSVRVRTYDIPSRNLYSLSFCEVRTWYRETVENLSR
jgi:hypothetical protein